jgi:hypothetical protein
MYGHEESYEENICRVLKNDSEGISHEENIRRYIGGIFWQYFWKEIKGGLLGKYLSSISGKNLRGVTGEISEQYFWKEFEGGHWGNICRIF